jgi:hypothetical protein
MADGTALENWLGRRRPMWITETFTWQPRGPAGSERQTPPYVFRIS